MPPIWKVKREFERLKSKISAPILSAVIPFMIRQHDKTKYQRFLITKGRAVQGPQIALLLLFQPKGLAGSVYETCKYLTDHGFSVFLVSNTPLSKPDRDALAKHCFEILERPNFGYDFGGYRDGVLHLLDAGRVFERLLVLNDSCWFPVGSGDEFLASVAQTDADMYGAVLSSRRDRAQGKHLQSFAFAFGPKLLASPDFRMFWQGLAVSNNRFWTVERCEMAMSPWFANRGYALASGWSFGDIDAVIPNLSIAELEQIVALERATNPAKQSVLTAMSAKVPHDDAWAQQVREMMLKGTMRRYLMLAHPLLLRKIRFPFLKKNREGYYTAQRQAFLEQVAPDLSATILEEIIVLGGGSAPTSAVSQTADTAV